MYDSYKIISKAVRVIKPQEAQKARALWVVTAAKDRREEFYDPVRKVNFFLEEIKRDWSCGKNTSKTQLLPWTKPYSAWKISIKVGSKLCGSKAALISNRVV